MKKTIISSLAVVTMFGVISFTAGNAVAQEPAPEETEFAAEESPTNIRTQLEKARQEARERMEKNREAAEARQEALREQESEIKTLVKQYKNPKKKGEKPAEVKEQITKILAEMRQGQLEEQEAVLKDVKERIGRAEKELEAKKHSGSVRAWVSRNLEHVLEADGNVMDLFDDEQNVVDKALLPYNKSQERLFMLQQAKLRAQKKAQTQTPEQGKK